MDGRLRPVDAPVDFANPPNEVAYNRRVTLSDTFAPVDGTGLGLGAPSDPGPGPSRPTPRRP